jgi:hypothetical protein
MRWKLPIALGALAVLLACMLGSACSANCKPGTLTLHIALLDNTPLADHVTIVGSDPGAAVSLSFPHVPNPAAADVGIEHITLEVRWPDGFPTDAVVHLTTTALAGDTILGSDPDSFRLGQSCSEGSLLVSARAAELDSDGGSD